MSESEHLLVKRQNDHSPGSVTGGNYGLVFNTGHGGEGVGGALKSFTSEKRGMQHGDV